MEPISKIKRVIDLWPTRVELAADLGVPAARVHKWRQNGSIPARYHGPLIDAARARQIPLSADELVDAHRRETSDEAAE